MKNKIFIGLVVAIHLTIAGGCFFMAYKSYLLEQKLKQLQRGI